MSTLILPLFLKKNQNIINGKRDQNYNGRKWGTKKNLDCLGTKQLGGRRYKYLPINRSRIQSNKDFKPLKLDQEWLECLTKQVIKL